MGINQFTIVAENPNNAVGGTGCLCSPNRQPTGCKGPFVQFHNASMSPLDTDQVGALNSPHAVVCRDCLLDAAAKVDGPAVAAPTRGRKRREPTESVAFEQLSPEEQANVSQFPEGSLVGVRDGDYVKVPASLSAPPDLEPEPTPTEPVVNLPTPHEGPLPLEVPGANRDEFVPADNTEPSEDEDPEDDAEDVPVL